MDIGLYNLKYPFRKLIGFLLPFFKNISPNVVSLSLIPLGLMTAILYFFAPHAKVLYLLGALLIVLRMVIGTLDGLIAVTFDKKSDVGEMMNRIAPEICDILLVLGIAYSSPKYVGIGLTAIAMCWAVTFFGLIGVLVGRKIQSVGPVGQTDRIAALAFFSLLQFLGSFDFIYLFLSWVIIGSFVTLGLRIYRTFKPI